MKVPQKTKKELPYDAAIPLLWCISQKVENTNSERYMHPSVHISTIFNSQGMETTQVSFNRQIDKEEVAYIYSGILLSDKKKNEILPFAAISMDLEDIMLTEISQTEKDTCGMISLICQI